MNTIPPTTALAIAKHFSDDTQNYPKTLASGSYKVDGTYIVHVSGEIRKGKDSFRKPTVSVPWKIVVPLLLEKAGVTGQAAINLAAAAMKEALELNGDKSAQEAVEARCKDFEKASKKLEDMLGELPKAPVSGRMNFRGVTVDVRAFEEAMA